MTLYALAEVPWARLFDRLMNVLFDDRAFAQAATIGYHGDVRSLWQKFIESISGRK